MTKVSIHQPNFLPWLGYFQKLVQSDIHIILDDVQVPRRNGGSWSNRTRLLGHGTPRWLTVALEKQSGREYQVRELVAHVDWKDNCLSKIRAWYQGASHFGLVVGYLEKCLADMSSDICEFNIEMNFGVLDLLELERPLVIKSSTLGVETTATERLVDLVKAVGGDAYLIGHGSQSYFDESLFQAAGLGVIKQRLTLTPYPQHIVDSFVPGLSFLDSFFTIGPHQLRNLILGADEIS